MPLTRLPLERVRIRRGRLTLPLRVRQAVHFGDETTVVVKTIGDIVILAPSVDAAVASLTTNRAAFRREADAAGVTLKDLLTGLKVERKRYVNEVYG